MNMIRPHQVNLFDIIDEINEKLSTFRSVMNQASKAESEKDLQSIVFLYSPEEWEQIAITIMHYQFFWNEYHKLKQSEEELRKFANENASFLGYARDMVASWYSRIEGNNKKAEA